MPKDDDSGEQTANNLPIGPETRKLFKVTGKNLLKHQPLRWNPEELFSEIQRLRMAIQEEINEHERREMSDERVSAIAYHQYRVKLLERALKGEK